MAKTRSERQQRCNFCNKPWQEIGTLYEGANGLICKTCLTEGYKLLEAKEAEIRIANFDVPRPADIVAELDKFMIGQNAAKKAVAVAVVNHYKRIYCKDIKVSKAVSQTIDPFDDVEIEKSNICLVGPTGCGKTLLAQILAKKLAVPFAIGDATTLTEAGYVGEDVENLLLRLIQAADGDIKAAQRGIIYIDEVDKISRTSENRSITRDVSGEGVQQALLKMLEGTTANVPPHGGRKHPEQNYIPIDTKDILFIVGGTFVGIEQIIAKRTSCKQIGFSTKFFISEEQTKKELMAKIVPDDLVKFGMIPEFVGRLPIITNLDDLDVDALVQILVAPKNALTKQYRKLCALNGVELVFTDESLKEIALKAIGLKTGARALRSVCERFMQDLLYRLEDSDNGSTFEITPGVVNGETPIFECKRAAA